MWPGQHGKTVFPESWSKDKIVHAIGDITTSPSTKWYAQTGTGGAFTAKGDPAKWVAYEIRDGVRMRVVYLLVRWLPRSLMMLLSHLISQLGKFYVCKSYCRVREEI